MPIKVLIADDVAETRENIKRLLQFEKEITVVGEAVDGEDVIRQTGKLNPDIILMDINMPGLDGIKATEAISLKYPKTSIIIISVQGEVEYVRRAMAAGAREYMVKPFTSDELAGTIKNVYDFEMKRKIQAADPLKPMDNKDPQIITVFSTKGGVGKTTIVTNLAVSLFHETRKKVVIVDLDLQFGDVAVMMNVIPKRTITELIQDIGSLDAETLESYLVPHSSGVRVLPAPTRPEYAELITAAHVEKILNTLKQKYDYIIVDTPPFFHETTLTALDICQQILLIVSLDLPTIKNVKLGLEVLESLHHKGKVKLILNRSSNEIGIKCSDMERSLGMKVAAHIPSDGRVVVGAVNKGVPFVISQPGAKISQSVKELAQMIIKRSDTGLETSDESKKGLLSRLFG
ncbi:response regulator receiver protein [Thermincola ferriacetica]|uniref:Stage 0 sporulation protein A homolog n=1 Tax=Thermincola ferriacetica TaxID=281456 RepID=A0A0L6W4Q6_9FIRM|nr:response regulator [Thermincola ferriacetica]KNZ70084.1 response regulator receiver protein [Thermincola ferriacetica]